MKNLSKIGMIILSGAVSISSMFVFSGCGGKDSNAFSDLLEMIAKGDEVIKLVEDDIAGEADLSILDGMTIDLNGKTINDDIVLYAKWGTKAEFEEKFAEFLEYEMF